MLWWFWLSILIFQLFHMVNIPFMKLVVFLFGLFLRSINIWLKCMDCIIDIVIFELWGVLISRRKFARIFQIYRSRLLVPNLGSFEFQLGLPKFFFSLHIILIGPIFLILLLFLLSFSFLI